MVLRPWSVVWSPKFLTSGFKNLASDLLFFGITLLSICLSFNLGYCSKSSMARCFPKRVGAEMSSYQANFLFLILILIPVITGTVCKSVFSNEWEPNCPGKRSKKISIKLFLVIDQSDQWQSVRPTVPWSEWWKQIAGELLFLIIHLEVITGRVFSSNPCWYSVCLGR